MPRSRNRIKKRPGTVEQRVEKLLREAEHYANQNSAYTLEFARCKAQVATALIEFERFKAEKKGGKK
jgi:hypothetical protein